MEDTRTDDGAPRRLDIPLVVACSLAVAIGTYQTWLLNNGIFPVTSEAWPLARELQTAVGIAIDALALVAALRAPHLLRPRPLLAVTVACCAVSTAILWFAAGTAAGAAVGLALRATSRVLGTYLTGISLAQINDTRAVSVGVACAVLASALASTFLPAPGLRASVAIDTALALLMFALLWRTAAPHMERIAAAPGSEVQALASPRSFISPSHQVYVLMLIFSTASGFALSLRIAEFTPLASNLHIAVLACVVAWFVVARGRQGHEDALFTVSALLVEAGFLTAPLEDFSGGATANGLLYAGKSCFTVLSWTALAAICARNPAGMMMVLASGDIANGAGTFIGADLGHLCNALLATHPEAVSIVTGAAVLALFAYALTGLRGFSFAETIRGVEPAAPLPSPAPPTPSRDELLDAACDGLAAECGLTDREREVLGMLARGHNGYHVRDELTLSYNTVKTHVKRIYRKLGVHSQQELIDLVDGRAKG